MGAFFQTKTALIERNHEEQSEDVVLTERESAGTRSTTPRDPFPPGDTEGWTCPGAQPQLPRLRPCFPALQVLGGFSRHDVISCLKQLTNLHQNGITQIQLLRLTAPLQHTFSPKI